MKTEEDKNIDNLINKSLKENSFPLISDTFTDRLMKRIEQKLVWREIISEFFGKLGLVVILLLFAIGVLFIPQFSNFLKLLTGLTSKWQIILYPGIVVLFTFIFDQLVLKYLFSRKN